MRLRLRPLILVLALVPAGHTVRPEPSQAGPNPSEFNPMPESEDTREEMRRLILEDASVVERQSAPNEFPLGRPAKVPSGVTPSASPCDPPPEQAYGISGLPDARRPRSNRHANRPRSRPRP